MDELINVGKCQQSTAVRMATPTQKDNSARTVIIPVRLYDECTSNAVRLYTELCKMMNRKESTLKFPLSFGGYVDLEKYQYCVTSGSFKNLVNANDKKNALNELQRKGYIKIENRIYNVGDKEKTVKVVTVLHQQYDNVTSRAERTNKRREDIVDAIKCRDTLNDIENELYMKYHTTDVFAVIGGLEHKVEGLNQQVDNLNQVADDLTQVTNGMSQYITQMECESIERDNILAERIDNLQRRMQYLERQLANLGVTVEFMD